MDPFSLFVGSIGLVGSINTAYNTIENIANLPKAFREVGGDLPYVSRTLSEAHTAFDRITDGSPDVEAQKNEVLPITARCKDKLEKLKTIFEKVASYTEEAGEDGSWDVVAKKYYGTLLSWGSSIAKGHKVEVLMGAILKDIDFLSKRPLFHVATFTQVAELQEAIEKLSKVESSAPDSELDELSKANIQNNTDGGSGVQNNVYGNITGSHFGHGNQYNISGGKHSHITRIGYRAQSRDKANDAKRNKLMDALNVVKYTEAKDRNRLRVPGTCEWFVRHALFRKWRTSNTHGMLWVSADPGCGKSVLARHLVDHVLPDTNSTVCHFFFKDDFPDQKSAKNAISSILHQLFAQQRKLPYTDLFDLFENGGGHTPGTLPHLWDVFLSALSQIQPDSGRPRDIVCVLDAFDECTETEQIELARILGDFYRMAADADARKRPFNLKFVVTSRPYQHIRQEFGPLADMGLPVIHLSGEEGNVSHEIESEIGLFIESKVNELESRFKLEAHQTESLLKSLRGVQNRTYLWAYLTLDMIQDHLSRKKDVRDITSSLPPSVKAAYQSILAKAPSNAEERELQKKLLQIVVAATRPLTLEEMHFALSLKETHRSYDDVPAMRENSFREQVRNVCGLFITIIDSRIYLLHQTAREFLVGNSSTQADDTITRDTDNTVGPSKAVNVDAVSNTLLDLQKSHAVLFQICSWHVKFDNFQQCCDHNFYYFSGELEDYLTHHVFVDYSSGNFVHHYRSSGTYEDIVTMISLTEYLSTAPSHSLAWFQILFATGRTHHGRCMRPRAMTSLMQASFWGLDKVVKVLLEDSEINVNEKCQFGRSALAWAVLEGQDKVVETLLAGRIREKQQAKASSPAMIDVDLLDSRKRTLLHHATLSSDVRSISLLLAAGADVNAKDDLGYSPIMNATDYHHNEIAKQFLQAGADVNATTSASHTPLDEAVRQGNRELTRLFIAAGANVNAPGYLKRTPLHTAAVRGDGDCVRLLLEAGADVNKTANRRGETALDAAAIQGHGNIVNLLLLAGANVNGNITQGNQTPLIRATIHGRVKVVKRLLDANADVQTKDEEGHTAACRHVRIKVFGLIVLGRVLLTPETFSTAAYTLDRLSRPFQAITALYNTWVVAVLFDPYESM